MYSAACETIGSVGEKTLGWDSGRKSDKLTAKHTRNFNHCHCLALNFRIDPEEMEKEEQASAEKAVAKEEFQSKWTAPAPKFSAL